MSRMGTLGIFTTLFLLLEIYTYFGLKSIFRESSFLKWFNLLYGLQTIFVLFAFYKMYTGLTQGNVFRGNALNFYIGIVFTVFVTKMVFCSVMLIQDSIRFIYALFDTGKNIVSNGSLEGSYIPSRRSFIGMLGAGIASVPFFSMLYGITRGKYNYQVKEVSLAFKDLPKAFDGFKIVQISDIHSGSLDDKDSIMLGIEKMNALNPDVICFTGDLVNSDKDEINPFIDLFKKLDAKQGKFAILGNHDYYGQPQENEEREEYWRDFESKFSEMGFTLLKNEHRLIEKQGESIRLVGVENWGAGRWFPKIGDLDKALHGVEQNDFTILMSHDPTHWDEKVINHNKHVHLTLSGHTHGMQFGFQMPGFKWSPAQYRYPRWMGLYEEKGQYLYVNLGFGFLAFPGRVGMWPEITVFTLQTA